MSNDPALSADAQALRQQALRLLVRRDFSRQEMRQRLLAGRRSSVRPAVAEAQDVSAAGERAALIESVLDRLETERLLSDRRFAEGLVNGRATRYGRLRLAQALQAKGVAAELAQEVLAPLGGSEEDRALLQLQRRFRDPSDPDPKEKARRYRFLLARGFDGETVGRVLRRHASAQDDPAC